MGVTGGDAALRCQVLANLGTPSNGAAPDARRMAIRDNTLYISDL